MHEPGNVVLFLQYLCVLYLGIHGLVEVFLSRRCSLPWLANLMLYSAFFFFVLFSAMFVLAFTDFPKI